MAARLRRCIVALRSRGRIARAATITIAMLRVNKISGTGRSVTRSLMIASCTLNAAQPAAAKATPASGLATVLGGDMI
jgi:hypothetical protein